jgi:hypothetical protein
MKIKSVLKKTCSIALFFISVTTKAQTQKTPDESQLRPGQCYSLPDSKIYLENLKTRPDFYTQTMNEIGTAQLANLQNTDSVNYYFCQAKCKNQQGQIEKLWTTLSDLTSHFSDMNGFLCTGVSIENVQIVGSIYGPQPVIKPYWAFEKNLIQTAEWLRKINFKLSSDE